MAPQSSKYQVTNTAAAAGGITHPSANQGQLGLMLQRKAAASRLSYTCLEETGFVSEAVVESEGREVT